MLTVIVFLQENLTSLLTDDEMQHLIENFDRLDVNQGNNMCSGRKSCWTEWGTVQLPK